MRFQSFDWLSGHGTSAIISCPRNSAIKSFSVLTKGNHQDVAIFVVVVVVVVVDSMLIKQINYSTRASWIGISEATGTCLT